MANREAIKNQLRSNTCTYCTHLYLRRVVDSTYWCDKSQYKPALDTCEFWKESLSIRKPFRRRPGKSGQ